MLQNCYIIKEPLHFTKEDLQMPCSPLFTTATEYYENAGSLRNEVIL